MCFICVCGRTSYIRAGGYGIRSFVKYDFRSLHFTSHSYFKGQDSRPSFRRLYRRKGYFGSVFVGATVGLVWLMLKSSPENNTRRKFVISKVGGEKEQSEEPDDLFFPSKNKTQLGEGSILLSGLVFEMSLGVAGSLCAWKLGLPIFGKGFHVSLATFLQGTLGAVPLLGFVYLIEQLPFQWLKETASQTQRIIAEYFLSKSRSEIGVLCVCTGIAEEIAFRSFLFSWLVSRMNLSTPQGLIVSSVVFGVFHPVSPAYVCIASLAGSYFGFLYIITGNNVFVPAVAHAVYDFVVLEVSRNQKKSSSRKNKLE